MRSHKIRGSGDENDYNDSKAYCTCPLHTIHSPYQRWRGGVGELKFFSLKTPSINPFERQKLSLPQFFLTSFPMYQCLYFKQEQKLFAFESTPQFLEDRVYGDVSFSRGKTPTRLR